MKEYDFWMMLHHKEPLLFPKIVIYASLRDGDSCKSVHYSEKEILRSASIQDSVLQSYNHTMHM